jgi:hypothetical protein
MAKNKLLIDRQAFCNWYFDYDICKEFFLRHNILESLENDGVFKITLEDILKNVGYLPEEVVAEGQNPILNKNDDVDMNAYDIITFNEIKN